MALTPVRGGFSSGAIMQTEDHATSHLRNMNLRLSNQLNMVGTCLRVAQSRDYSAVWLGQELSVFATDLHDVEAGYKIALGKAALSDTSKGGASDVWAEAETTLENLAYVLARALAVHFKKNNNPTRRVQVDLTHTQIVQLRGNDLVAKAVFLRDIAQKAQSERNAVSCGVTKARIDALTRAMDSFHALLSQPRSRAITRSMLLRELETDTAALIEQLRDLDDLVLQFDGSAAGLRFIAAWEKARLIIDRAEENRSKAPGNFTADEESNPRRSPY